MSDAPSFDTLAVAVDGARGSLQLARPKSLNPLGQTALQELIDAACWFDTHPDLKVVVVSGAGRAFSAGADLAVFQGAGLGDGDPRRAADLGRRMADAIEAMRRLPGAKVLWRLLVEDPPQPVGRVEFDREAPIDVDTPEAYEAALRQLGIGSTT